MQSSSSLDSNGVNVGVAGSIFEASQSVVPATLHLLVDDGLASGAGVSLVRHCRDYAHAAPPHEARCRDGKLPQSLRVIHGDLRHGMVHACARVSTCREFI